LCTLALGGSASVLIFTPTGFFISVEVVEDPTSFFTPLPKRNTLVSCEDKGIKISLMRKIVE
jgi:hypothetical protein